MHQIKQTPPEAMTPEQRRQEVAGLLANGLVRLRTAGVRAAPFHPAESKFAGDLAGDHGQAGKHPALELVLAVGRDCHAVGHASVLPGEEGARRRPEVAVTLLDLAGGQQRTSC